MKLQSLKAYFAWLNIYFSLESKVATFDGGFYGLLLKINNKGKAIDVIIKFWKKISDCN